MERDSMARLVIGAVMVILVLPQWAGAVAGVCSGCHVMHASQGGSPLPTTGPEGYLLNKTCLGCHTGTNNGVDTTPYVYKASAPGAAILAGGSFYYSENSGDRKGHNPLVTGILNADGTLTEPPGWTNTGFAANGQVGGGTDNWANNPLTCAGVYGCHGRHDGTVESMHHANVTGTATTVDGSTLGKSYRFLKGIKGGEDNDYEYETAADHNVYIGANRVAGAADTIAGGTDTMSYFCAECHGIFHSGAGTDGLASGTIGSPWLRHPVDFSMPNSGEYAGYSSYNPAVPVATSDTTTATTDYDVTTSPATDRIVMCLSCHYAHAGPNNASLRWDYSKMLAETAAVADRNTGCFACHTAKDGDP